MTIAKLLPLPVVASRLGYWADTGVARCRSMSCTCS